VPDPTAKWYDLIYALDGKDYRSETTELVNLVDQHAPLASSLLDVACGTGRHLELLSDRFDDLAGIDLSLEMLEIAATRLGSIPLYRADMCEMDLGRRFDVITCLFSAIGHLPDTEALHQTVARFTEHLEPGGLIIIDGWVTPDRWEDGRCGVITGSIEGGHLARAARVSSRGRISMIDFHYLHITADAIEHLEEHIELTMFTEDDYRAAFTASGMSMEVVASPMPERDRYLGVKNGY